ARSQMAANPAAYSGGMSPRMVRRAAFSARSWSRSFFAVASWRRRSLTGLLLEAGLVWDQSAAGAWLAATLRVVPGVEVEREGSVFADGGPLGADRAASAVTH